MIPHTKKRGETSVFFAAVRSTLSSDEINLFSVFALLRCLKGANLELDGSRDTLVRRLKGEKLRRLTARDGRNMEGGS